MEQLPRASQSGKLRDVVVATCGAAIAIFALTAALRPTTSRPKEERPTVARIKVSTGTLQLRPAMTLGWQTAVRGDDLCESDSVYVPPGGEARVEFFDGTILELDERSLVVIEPERPSERTITLRQGSVFGVVGAKALSLATATGTAKLPPQTTAAIEVKGKGLDITVKEGRAEVLTGKKSLQLGRSERATIQDEVPTLSKWVVTLLTPEAQYRVWATGAQSPVTLSWSGAPAGARLQLAKDRLFAFVSREVDAEKGTHEIAFPSPGVTWWRIVDKQGQALSEARRFSLVEGIPPANRLPRSGEVVLAPAGALLEFAWTSIPGMSRYQLEVSGSQGFEPIAIREATSESHLKLRSSLAEGNWFWRVRGVDESLGATLPSEPTRFRVIHKGIPAAPELLNPELEVP